MTINIATKYLGLDLDGPLVAAASPLTGNLNTLSRLREAGASAAVLYSLFEEQIKHDPQQAAMASSMDSYNAGADAYLRHIELAKKEVEIPLFGSLNASGPGGWTKFASLIEQAGADAIEVNLYHVPVDANLSAAQVEESYLESVAGARAAVSIPLAVKIGPYFTSLPNFARRIAEAGADGLVLFNRYLEPDIDLATCDVIPQLSLSRPAEIRLALRWIAILYDQVDISLAATGGVHDAAGAAKAILAGADVVQIASALIQHGPAELAEMLTQLRRWLEESGHASLHEVRGMLSRGSYTDHGVYERANYLNTLREFSEHEFTR